VSAAAELVAGLARAEAGRPPLRVRALHLPPAEADGKAGEFCALELEDGSLGLSYVLLGDTLARLRAGEPLAAGRVVGAVALELASWTSAPAGVERTLGYAAANALTASLYARAGYRPPDAADSIGHLDLRPGDSVGMVGLFRSLPGKVVAAGARLTVLELAPALAGDRDGFRVTLDPGELAGCNKVIATSTILLNATLEPILAACRGAATLALVGPGASCLPDPLFARGVTLLGGVEVVDPAGFLRALGAGAKWGGTVRQVALAASGYLGLEGLLRRVRR
jgi:uncharacterized protein (DUF4213/DUF364 family)